MGKDLIEFIAKSLVDHPEQVSVVQMDEAGSTVLQLKVATDDVGKVIGKHGRIAKAMRTLLSSTQDGKGRYSLDILD